MAMNLENEKNLKLSTQERYEILDFAMQAAEDGGFLNSFVFQRAIYLFAAIVLYEDRKEELSHIVSESPIKAWDTLLEDGIIDEMLEQYPEEMDVLAEEAEKWYKEYAEYAHSARGLLNIIQELSGDIVANAAGQLRSSANDSGVLDLLEIADEWGMNRPNKQVLENISEGSAITEPAEETLL